MRQSYAKADGLAPLAARQTSWRFLCTLLPDHWEARCPCARSRSASVYRDGQRVLTVGLCPRWVAVEESGCGHVVSDLESFGWEVR